jgi:hypothetical protein
MHARTSRAPRKNSRPSIDCSIICSPIFSPSPRWLWHFEELHHRDCSNEDTSRAVQTITMNRAILTGFVAILIENEGRTGHHHAVIDALKMLLTQ